MAKFKGALVAPETGPGGSEESDVAGAADPLPVAVLVPDLIIPNEPLNDFGHDARFLFPHKLGIESALAVFVAIVDWNFKTGDGMAIGGNRAGCRQGREAWLSGRLG
jgi:hypothetical protein